MDRPNHQMNEFMLANRILLKSIALMWRIWGAFSVYMYGDSTDKHWKTVINEADYLHSNF